jgi:DNA polymerase III epsilon subunit-like protein
MTMSAALADGQSRGLSEQQTTTDAVAVHGLTAEFLADKPLFADVADELLAFVGAGKRSRNRQSATASVVAARDCG